MAPERRVRRLLAAVAVMAAASVTQAQDVRLYAAGSLRAAMTDLGTAFRARDGVSVAGEFGASGLLRERIAAGAPAEVFASANMEHPRLLAEAGRAGPVQRFARNRLCALSSAPVDGEVLLARMLDPSVKLGTSTPQADPSGDYAWEVFRKAESLRPGAQRALEAKALKFTGGRDSPQAQPGRSLYGKLVSEGAADLFLLYCTAADEAVREYPALLKTALPAALLVGADYGLVVMNGASQQAARFAAFVLSDAGQALLVKHGFSSGRE